MHLGARDVQATRKFYETYLGFRFQKAIAADFIFLTNEEEFLLAITKEKPAPFPEWFHVGFKQESADAVRSLRARMKSDGLAVDEMLELPDRVAYGVSDPDGFGVEVFWEK
jgi:lactoylglutathione lyase